MIHMSDVGFDEFTLTLIQLGLMIKELNHTGSCTERFIFISDGLPPYTVRCHWWILGAIRMILMIDHSKLSESEEFWSIERSFDDVDDEITTYLIIIQN